MTMSTPDSPFEVAIIGGGIAGLTLAIALLNRGVKVQVYEAAHKFGEIGAGVAFGYNAVQAMKLCHKGVFESFETVATHNQWPSKKTTYFDFVDGYNQTDSSGKAKHLFTTESVQGANSVHRADFLDEMVKLVPNDISHFGKRLQEITELDSGKMQMKFKDGSTAEADAVIGCDGIKSRTRELIVGEDSPAAHPHYTHKYAYRGLIPVARATEALGEEAAVNAYAYIGPGHHVLTFPVKGGTVMNVVAFVTDKGEWPDSTRLTLPATKAQALKDFEGWGQPVMKILEMLEDNLDCWALFDLYDHPLEKYYKGRVVLCGDAAHATTPHHGSGAGFCCEDSAVMADILAEASRAVKEDRAKTNHALQAAFEAYEESRKPRSQWLVQSSRFMSDLYELQSEGFGSDYEKIKAEITQRFDKIWYIDVQKMCDDAVKGFQKRI